MDKIQLVDLKKQYLNIREEIDNAILKVLDKSIFIKGGEVNKFQEELAHYLNTPHVITCGNGTDALQIALMALDLQKGDEIIVPSFTFGATVEVIVLLGLKPVLVDVEPHTFNINPTEIKKVISSKTKAIMPVHLYGQICNMEEITNIAREYGLHIIEDACQAIGTEYQFNDKTIKKAGTIGTIGCFSFFPSKNLGCYGDGGAIVTNSDKLAEKIQAICQHGSIKKYHYKYIGVNSRLDTLQAAILNIKLKYLNQYAEKRQKVAEFYDEQLLSCHFLKTPFKSLNSTHTYHQYAITLDNSINRENFIKYLQAKDIPTGIYYPVPLHLQEAYLYLGYNEGDLPTTEKLCKNVVSLPMHTELTKEQLEYITKTILQYFN